MPDNKLLLDTDIYINLLAMDLLNETVELLSSAITDVHFIESEVKRHINKKKISLSGDSWKRIETHTEYICKPINISLVEKAKDPVARLLLNPRGSPLLDQGESELIIAYESKFSSLGTLVLTCDHKFMKRLYGYPISETALQDRADALKENIIIGEQLLYELARDIDYPKLQKKFIDSGVQHKTFVNLFKGKTSTQFQGKCTSVVNDLKIQIGQDVLCDILSI